MVVQHNLTAINSNRMLGLTTKSQAKSTEKLSSGYKINRAADDAAGLFISEKMRRQIRGLTQASANAQDGISAVQTAEGALTEVHDMLQRMDELATKAANGTMQQDDRQAVQDEIDQLITEINRVAETTTFNEMELLKGAKSGDGAAADTAAVKQTAALSAAGKKQLETQLAVKTNSYAAGSADALKASADAVTTATMSLTGTAVYATTGNASNGGTAVAVTDDNMNDYFQVADDGTVSLKAGAALWDAGSSASANDVSANIDTYVTGKGVSEAVTGDIDKYVELVDGEIKYKEGKVLYSAAADPDGQHGAQTVQSTETQIKEADLGNYFETAGNPICTKNDGSAVLAADADLSAYFDEYGNYKGGLYLKDDAGDYKEIGADQIGKYFDFTPAEAPGASVPALEFNLHVGAESDIKNKISVSIEAMTASGIGVDVLAKTGVMTEDDATKAIDTIKQAVAKVSEQRSALGAVQNRLEHTINNLDNVVENTTAAESQIRDTDMATEMVKYSNNNILAQAGQSMLAQANQANQGVLSLLG